MYVLIMAGGSGTRLWPASRKNTPKQLLPFIGKRTLLQNTFTRLRKGFSNNKIFIATGKKYFNHVHKQLPQLDLSHCSIEPAIKDRGPAIGLAALIMHHHDPESTFVTAWSDHYINDEAAYFKTLTNTEVFLRDHPKNFVTIGVTPTFPHTGLGYIEMGPAIKNSMGINVFKVKSFKEKPDLKQAQKFLTGKKYLWNTGYFVCKTSFLLVLYQKHLPEVYSLLLKIKPFIGTKKQQAAINKYYAQMPVVDIERGILEKSNSIVVLPSAFDWVDVGSWKIIKEVLSQPNDNLTKGKVITHEAGGNLIYNYESKLVAAIGLKDIVIINTKDALLVANKNDSEQVKELVKKLQADKKLKKYL